MRILLAVIGDLVVALGVMTALWISTNNRLSALAHSSAAAAAQSQVPDVKAVAERRLSGIVPIPALTDMLDKPGLSSAVIDRMGRPGTRQHPSACA